MATVNSKDIVDRIIKGNGVYSEGGVADPTVLKIVQYNNQFNGAIAYRLVYEGEGDYNRYERSDVCLNATVIFEREP